MEEGDDVVKTLRYYNYFDAHLAAHQMRMDGCVVEVYEFVYSQAFSPGGEFRVDVFKKGEGEEGGRTDFTRTGLFGNFVDGLLRTLLIALVLYPLIIWFGNMLAEASRDHDPSKARWNFGNVELLYLLVLLAIPFFLLFTIRAYEGYRKGYGAWSAVFQLTGIVLVVGGTLPIIAFLEMLLR